LRDQRGLFKNFRLVFGSIWALGGAVIRYRFALDSGQVFQFSVDHQRTGGLVADNGGHAAWTRLEFNRCANCPLPSEAGASCPVAIDVEQVAHQFRDILSYTKTRVEVQTRERSYLKECDVQTGLRSLLGLIMATSTCPILSRFKTMAAIHLPFATLEETLFRTAGAFLLRQFFIQRAGGAPDWEMHGLQNFYQEVHTVNQGFSARLVTASEKDANLNAIGSLLYLSMGVTYSLLDQLQELKSLFGPAVSGP
jgi:hypothetical protein